MGELQGAIGDEWAAKCRSLLRRLGWVQQGAANESIPCTKHQGGRTHGLDLVFTYTDPFQGEQTTGVIVEAKSRQWSSFCSSLLKEFLEQVMGSLECATIHPQYRKRFAYDGPTEFGLVLLWCNDQDSKGTTTYDHEKYLGYLGGVQMPNKHKDLAVFMASNYDILRWATIADHIDSLKTRKSNPLEGLEFFYPSINGSLATFHSQLTLPLMFSDYVFCKGTRIDDANRTINVTVVYCFADPTLNELSFMRDALKKYQLIDNKCELQIYLYNANKIACRSAVDQFRRETEQAYPPESRSSRIRIDIDYLTPLPSVPDEWLEEDEK